MKKALFVAIILASCKNSPAPILVITADSLKKFDAVSQRELSDDIAALNKIYEAQIDLAQHSEDDSIRYYGYQLELARAAGKNVFILLNIERKIALLKQDAAEKALAIASKQAKREMDMVYESQFREQNEGYLYALQTKLDSNIITRAQYDDAVLKVKARMFKSDVPVDSALKISMEYHKKKYADGLNQEQKLLEAKIDSESKK